MSIRARIIDGATSLVRALDARRERDELRAEVKRLRSERDDLVERVENAEHVADMAWLEKRAAIFERDARIPTDIDGAQAWAEAHGMAVGHDHAGWHCRDEHDGGMVAGGGRAWVVGQAVGRVLSRTWRGDA